MHGHSEPSLEVEELVTRCMGNRDFALRIVGRFRSLLRSDIGELERAFAAGELTTVGQIAHRLRGAAGMVAARRLSELCVQIEDLAPDSGAASEIGALIEALGAEEDRFLESADGLAARFRAMTSQR